MSKFTITSLWVLRTFYKYLSHDNDWTSPATTSPFKDCGILFRVTIDSDNFGFLVRKSKISIFESFYFTTFLCKKEILRTYQDVLVVVNPSINKYGSLYSDRREWIRNDLSRTRRSITSVTRPYGTPLHWLFLRWCLGSRLVSKERKNVPVSNIWKILVWSVLFMNLYGVKTDEYLLY